MSYDDYKEPAPRPRLRIGPGSISPFIKWMLIINAAVFLLQYFMGGRLEQYLGLTPYLYFEEFRLYQVFTYMFLHSTGYFLHLIFNMFILWMFGTEIELTWGTRRFARFYFLAGLAGGILTLIIFPNQEAPMIGASGAIYGVLVAYWLMFPNRTLYLYFVVPVKVKWAIPGMILLGFLFSGGGVAHMAHLGGALYGLISLKLAWRPRLFGGWIKNLRYRRNEAKLERNRQHAEDVMKRVDAILDKINEVGIENLSRDERKFLEEASSRLSRPKDRSENSR